MGVDGSGHPEPRGATGRGSEHRVGAEVVGHGDGVGVEVEEVATALYGRCQVPEVVEVEVGPHVPLIGGELGGAAPVRKGEGPGEHGRRGRLDTRNGSMAQERQGPGRVVGEAMGQAQAEGVGGPVLVRAAVSAQLRGGAREDVANGVVELPHAREAGRERHRRHRELGGLDEHACGLGPLGTSSASGPAPTSLTRSRLSWRGL